MTPLDPAELARFQLRRDRAATRKFPGLFEHKLARMSASPLAFLRGAAPLFYEIMKTRPELASGPAGKGWLTGDMHLENFGAYRPDPHSFAKGRASDSPEAIFDLNDFDDAVVGPFYFDVLRLLTSLILGGRELGADGVRALGLCDELLDAYGKALSGGPLPGPLPAPVTALILQVSQRPQSVLLDARTTGRGDHRRFTLGDRYQKLEGGMGKARDAFATYVASLAADDRKAGSDHFDVLDAARRIAGTGSLGSVRIAVLTRGKGGHDGQWIFDLKEQGVPSASLLVGVPKMDPAVRVITAVRACLAHPPRMLGTTRIARTSLFGRRIAPQEDKLDLTRVHHADLPSLASTLGALLGRAHRRGATELPKKAWSSAERAALVDRAITLAGIHEAIYLALCKEMKA